MLNLIKKLYDPYEKPEGKRNIYAIVEEATVKNKPLTEDDWRQMILSTYARIESHEKICMIRGGVMITGLIILIVLQLDMSWSELFSFASKVK